MPAALSGGATKLSQASPAKPLLFPSQWQRSDDLPGNPLARDAVCASLAGYSVRRLFRPHGRLRLSVSLSPLRSLHLQLWWWLPLVMTSAVALALLVLGWLLARLRAAPTAGSLDARSALYPQIHLDYATYKGKALPCGVSQWVGIRYAAPPVGALRFAEPQDPRHERKTQKAYHVGRLRVRESSLANPQQHRPLCYGFGDAPSRSRSEDCLFADVYAPSHARPGSKLPVFVWLSAGGFNWLVNSNFNGTGLVLESQHNMIVVTFSYRVSLYGFLASPGLVEAGGSVNNGLKDQRKLLHWVKKYISHFGGDPNHVVLVGPSAGAASIIYQLTAYGGRDDKLFAGAAAQSPAFGPILTIPESDYQYTHLLRSLKCPTRPADAALICLRAVSAGALQSKASRLAYPGAQSPPRFIYNPVIDFDLIRDYPYAALRDGKFVQVPMIVGDDTNGGWFAPRVDHVRSQARADEWLKSQFPFLTPDQLHNLKQLYTPTGPSNTTYIDKHGKVVHINPPNRTSPSASDPVETPIIRSLASPLTSWTSTNFLHHLVQRAAPKHKPDYAWAVGALYGEMRYMCPSLFLSAVISNHTSASSHNGSTSSTAARVWTYRYNVVDAQELARGLGVPHVVETSAIWGPVTHPRGTPFSYFQGRENHNVVKLMQRFWISFVRDLDPNRLRWKKAPEWTRYDHRGLTDGRWGERMVLETNTSHPEPIDKGLQRRCEYVWSIALANRQ